MAIWLLRPRGDRPPREGRPKCQDPASPPTRRSTRASKERGPPPRGFSAHAEIDPHKRRETLRPRRLLRPRGDRPRRRNGGVRHHRASPPTRRSTRGAVLLYPLERGFSAHAEIDPSYSRLSVIFVGLLRPRGDRPLFIAAVSRRSKASPPTRRSTLRGKNLACWCRGFSAHAEIDRADHGRHRAA